MIQEQDEDCRKIKVPLLLPKLLALFFFLFFLLSSKCSSSLFCLFSLDCGSRFCFCSCMNTARNRGSAQMCVNVALHVLYVLLLTVINAMLLTTVRY